MPPKSIKQSQLFYLDDGEYKPLGFVDHVNLTIEDEEATCDENRFLSFEPMSLTIKCFNFRGLMIFIKTGNDLYLRFPKKLRRKKHERT